MSLPRAKSRTGNPSLLLQLERRKEKRRERKGIIIWSSTENLILHFLSSSTRRWPTETLLTTTTTTMWMTFIVTKGSGIWICGCSAQLLRSCYSPWSQFFPLNCNSSSKTILNINSSTPPPLLPEWQATAAHRTGTGTGDRTSTTTTTVTATGEGEGMQKLWLQFASKTRFCHLPSSLSVLTNKFFEI